MKENSIPALHELPKGDSPLTMFQNKLENLLIVNLNNFKYASHKNHKAILDFNAGFDRDYTSRVHCNCECGFQDDRAIALVNSLTDFLHFGSTG